MSDQVKQTPQPASPPPVAGAVEFAARPVYSPAPVAERAISTGHETRGGMNE